MSSKQNSDYLNSKEASDISKKDSDTKYKDGDDKEGTNSNNELVHNEIPEATNHESNPENFFESVNEVSFIEGIENQRVLVQLRNPNVNITQEVEDNDTFDFAYSSRATTQDNVNVNAHDNSQIDGNDNLSDSDFCGDDVPSKEPSYIHELNEFTFNDDIKEDILDIGHPNEDEVENMSSSLNKRQLSHSSINMPSAKFGYSDNGEGASDGELIIELTPEERNMFYPISPATKATSGASDETKISKNHTNHDENYRGRLDGRLGVKTNELFELNFKACTTGQTRKMADGTTFEGFYKPSDSDLANIIEYEDSEDWHAFRTLCMDIIQHRFDPEKNKTKFKVDVITLDTIQAMMPNNKPKNGDDSKGVAGAKGSNDLNKCNDSCFDDIVYNMGPFLDSESDLPFAADSIDKKYQDLPVSLEPSLQFDFTPVDVDNSDLVNFYDFALDSRFYSDVGSEDNAMFLDRTKKV